MKPDFVLYCGNMEMVGRHLEDQAAERASVPTEFDQFGRSAFNRYYYATFLLARAMMLNFNPQWRGTHKGFPDQLTESTGKLLRTAKARARKVGDKGLEEKCAVGVHHLHELAELLRNAYAARVIADYEPEEQLKRSDDGKVTLGRLPISTAKHWPEHARRHIGEIEQAWKAANGG